MIIIHKYQGTVSRLSVKALYPIELDFKWTCDLSDRCAYAANICNRGLKRAPATSRKRQGNVEVGGGTHFPVKPVHFAKRVPEAANLLYRVLIREYSEDRVVANTTRWWHFKK